MNNEQAYSYAKLALVNCKVEPDTIRKVLREMYYLFDIYTEEEAERKAKAITLGGY